MSSPFLRAACAERESREEERAEVAAGFGGCFEVEDVGVEGLWLSPSVCGGGGEVDEETLGAEVVEVVGVHGESVGERKEGKRKSELKMEK